MTVSDPSREDISPSVGIARRFATNLRQNLSRVTSDGRYIPELDGLRFIAIFAVSLYHIPGTWIEHHRYGQLNSTTLHGSVSWLYAFGYDAVLFFFCISGFILSLPFARHFVAGSAIPPTRRFLLRRVTRLEPPFLISLSLIFLFGIILGRFAFAQEWPHYLATIFYAHQLLYNEPSTINNMTWSLETEAQFYLLAPVLAKFFLSRRSIRLFVLPIVVILLGYLKTQGTIDRVLFASYAQYFLAGMFASALYTEWPRKSVGGSVKADGLAFILAAVFFFLHPPGRPLLREIALPLVLSLFMLTCLYTARFARMLRWEPVAIIGGMCYTIYLYHGRLITLPIVFVLSKLVATHSFTADILIISACLLPIILCGSVLLFIAFERPFMAGSKYKRSKSKELRTRSRDAATGGGPSETEAKALPLPSSLP